MGRVSNGAMAAVLNASKEEIEEILKENGLANVCLANYNTPSQIVLSGLADEIAKGEKLFRQGKMRYYPLATSGAFHSAFMQEAMEQFKQFLDGFEFAAPKIPVIANVTARPYESDAIVKTLSSQIASTVRWCESIQYLLALGAKRHDAVEFEEVGHGDVLTRLVHTIKAQTPQDVLEDVHDEMNLPRRLKGRTRVGMLRSRPAAPEKVTAWNKRYPIGTKVKSSIADYDHLETRSEAVVLFGPGPRST